VFGICFDSAQRTRSTSFFQLFPMTMNATSIPFCHSSNTIRVYKRHYKEHGANISYNIVDHINYGAFHTIAKVAYIALINANVASKDIELPCPNF